MDDSADKGSNGKGLGDGENAENKAVKSDAAEGATPEHKLPVVWSPKLDAADDIEQDIVDVSFRPSDEPPPHEEIPVSEAAGDSAATASAAPSSRSSRFVLLAASVSIAAAIGSFAATLAAVGIGRINAASVASVSAPEPSTGTVDANSVAKVLKAQLAELNAMKSSLDSATHYANAQFSSISDRLEKVERAQTDPAQLAHIADSVDHLTRLNTSVPETTGSIMPPTSSAPAAAPAPVETKITDRILEDWVLEDVHGDRALVASRYGGEFLVMPGSVLPGAGRVDAVKRQDGQWVVITARGLIVQGR